MKHLFLLSFIVALITSCDSDKFSEKEKQVYIVKGKEIGKATLKKLGSNLMYHIKTGGTKEAIPFCNVKADILTTEIADKYKVSIKRTSHKIRSKKNKPNQEEEAIIKHYLSLVTKGEKLKPIVKKEKDNKVHFYAPIIAEGKCLMCHGVVGEQITSKTDSILKVLYPNDKATGFKVGNLRGVLAVTFNE